MSHCEQECVCNKWESAVLQRALAKNNFTKNYAFTGNIGII